MSEIKIVSRYDSTKVLFVAACDTMREAVRLAIASRADLRGADLRGADLSGADLRGANLYGADLSRANLRGANLSGADLRGAHLSSAHLSSADLSGADLSGADLSGADLYGADLSGADLRSANLRSANLSGAKEIPPLAAAQTRITPVDGAFEGWKKCRAGVLVRVQIPAESPRSNATGRKCRASFVTVLDVIGAKVGVSIYDPSIKYIKGEIVRCGQWNEDRWVECGGGIHFFITREEAEACDG